MFAQSNDDDTRDRGTAVYRTQMNYFLRRHWWTDYCLFTRFDVGSITVRETKRPSHLGALFISC